MQNLLVSIIIPVYKVEPYIVSCIDSVLRQTYRNLEVILVDDCTPDHSMELAKECIEQSPLSKDLSFIYLKHERNRGLSAARNTGIDSATGEYVYFLDSDDEITENCIQLMTKCIEDYPKTELVCAGAKVNKDLEWFSFKKKTLPNYSEDKNWINRALLQRSTLLMTAWNKLISREFLLSNKLYFIEGVIHEDDIWNFDIAKHVSRLAVCRHDTYLYKIRDGSITSDLSKTYRNRMILLNYFVHHITDPYRSRQISFIFHFIKIHYPCGIPEDLRNDMNCVVNKMIKESRNTQKYALWVYYHIPMCILCHTIILKYVEKIIGEV